MLVRLDADSLDGICSLLVKRQVVVFGSLDPLSAFQGIDQQDLGSLR